MTVKEVLVQHWIVVGERLSEPRQPGSGDLFQCRFVCFISAIPTTRATTMDEKLQNGELKEKNMKLLVLLCCA